MAGWVVQPSGRSRVGSNLDNDGGLLVAAMILQQKASISFWDALIVEAAAVGGCDRLYAEGLNPRQRFGSVEIVNPFAR